jgi:hypothetical protein
MTFNVQIYFQNGEELAYQNVTLIEYDEYAKSYRIHRENRTIESVREREVKRIIAENLEEETESEGSQP